MVRHCLLDQFLLQCRKVDGRHVHQHDSRIREPVLEVVGRPFGLDDFGPDLVQRQRFDEHLGPSRLRCHDQHVRRGQNVNGDAVAIVLANESRELLLGERAHLAQVRKVRNIIQSEPSVREVGDLFTLQFGPDQILLAVSIHISM